MLQLMPGNTKMIWSQMSGIGGDWRAGSNRVVKRSNLRERWVLRQDSWKGLSNFFGMTDGLGEESLERFPYYAGE